MKGFYIVGGNIRSLFVKKFSEKSQKKKKNLNLSKVIYVPDNTTFKGTKYIILSTPSTLRWFG